MRQSELDKEMVELGRQRFWSKVNKARAMGLETTTVSGQRLLRESTMQMEQALISWMKTAEKNPGRKHKALPYLAKLLPKVTGGIVCKIILDSISQHKTLVSTAMAVSRYLEDEIKFKTLKEDEPAMWNHIERVLDKFTSYLNKQKFIKKTAKDNNIILSKWNKVDALKVGVVCVELFRESTGLIDIITRKNARGRAVTMVLPTDDLLEWIKNADLASEFLKPVFLPMTDVPSIWSDPFLGGYNSKELHRRPLIKAKSDTYHDEIKFAPMDSVYKGVNALQNTSFRINPIVHETMRYLWKQGTSIGNLPCMGDEELPTKPIDIETNEDARKEWRRSAARIRFDNERQASKRLQLSKVLWMADKFKDDKFYYPHFLDFRGRAYQTSSFLTPSGPDWSRSLLTFGEGIPIESEDAVAWLAIHVANCQGMSKSSFEERIDWTWNNQELISDIAKDPLGCTAWGDADEPWQMLAACVEWDAFIKHGMGYNSSLPIPQDATTQGLQIFALLLRDPIAAMATNCIQRERPGDVYAQVAENVIEKLKVSKNRYAPIWLDFGITRATTKRSAMTLTYGSSYYACKQYTYDWFYDTLKHKKGGVNPFGDETYRPCNFLSELVWESISDVVRSARQGMDWLQEVASIAVQHETPIRWITPNGFIVKMDYQQSRTQLIKTSIGEVIRAHTLRFPTGGMNRRKNVNGVAPNVIHSFDGMGGLLGRTLQHSLSMGIKSYSMIHDSYGTHVQRTPELALALRKATVDIFEEDLLENFRSQIAAQLPSGVYCPSPPEKGNFDIREVLGSDYYFS